MAIGLGSSSSINVSDEMLGCESLTLSHVRLIKDGALRFCHVARENEASRNRICLIINRCLRCHHTSNEVHWARLISTVITLQMND